MDVDDTKDWEKQASSFVPHGFRLNRRAASAWRRLIVATERQMLFLCGFITTLP